MEQNNFTSGPVRTLSLQELGVDCLTDYELLSDSGHNLVYRAQMGGKWVVLKAAKPTEGELTRNRLLLEREFEIMHRLDSIYVVQTIAMVDNQQLGRAILMEYVHGRPLDRFLAENPSLSERRRVADELLEALIFLHERQVVHGDLKPSNILITDAGNHVRLIDFGFADNDAYIAKNIGSSPSVATTVPSGNEYLSVAKDIYALGKILQMLFLGRMRGIIRRCCSVKPTQQYESVRQVRAAVQRYWRMRWLLPVLSGVLLAVAALLWLSRSYEPLQQPVAESPSVDSVWLCARNEAEEQFASLCQIYVDSLRFVPEKTMNAAIPLLSNYGNRLLEERNRLIETYPQYENSLHQFYLSRLLRDYQRLRNICEDYPLVYSKSE